MEVINLGICAREIMNENFPILDSTTTLQDCSKKLSNFNKYEVCVVLNNGFIYSVLTQDDILRAWYKYHEKTPLAKIKSQEKVKILDPETDISEVIRMMEEGTEFFLIRDRETLGIITKREIAEINQEIFDILYEKRSNYNHIL